MKHDSYRSHLVPWYLLNKLNFILLEMALLYGFRRIGQEYICIYHLLFCCIYLLSHRWLFHPSISDIKLDIFLDRFRAWSALKIINAFWEICPNLFTKFWEFLFIQSRVEFHIEKKRKMSNYLNVENVEKGNTKWQSIFGLWSGIVALQIHILWWQF